MTSSGARWQQIVFFHLLNLVLVKNPLTAADHNPAADCSGTAQTAGYHGNQGGGGADGEEDDDRGHVTWCWRRARDTDSCDTQQDDSSSR